MCFEEDVWRRSRVVKLGASNFQSLLTNQKAFHQKEQADINLHSIKLLKQNFFFDSCSCKDGKSIL